MKKSSRILLGAVCLFSLSIGFSSCVSTETLYHWDKYENASYAYTKEPNEKNLNNLAKSLHVVEGWKQRRSYEVF